MDLIVSVSRSPVNGETIMGDSFETKPGGKGANQAVAASRLGANVNIIGRVGQDVFGESLVDNLKRENISTEGVNPVLGVPSGVAIITIREKDNSIIVISGANDYVTAQYVQDHSRLIQNSDIVLVQMEIPMEAIEETTRICKKFNVPFILNPAPAQKVDPFILDRASFITPNEIERDQILTGEEEMILAKWANKLIVTKGKEGALYHDQTNIKRIPAFLVDVIDTTGAGDTFNGAFAYYMARNKNISKGCEFANAASALAIQKIGAQTGMPTKKEIETLLSRKKELNIK